MKILFEKRDLKKVLVLEYKKYENYEIIDILKNVEPEFRNSNIYFIDNNNNIVTYINKSNIINFLIDNKNLNLKIKDLKHYSSNIAMIYNDDNLIYIYNTMRNKYDFLPLIDRNTNKIIGELYYLTISKKFYDILLKKREFNTYNEEVLKLLIEKEKNLFDNIDFSVIGVKPENLNVIKNFYGEKFVDKFLKKISNILIHTLRRIDMTFWYNNTFYLVIFNTNKIFLPNIVERIKKNILYIEVNKISTNFIIKSIVIPEEELNIELALEKIRYLIKKEELEKNKF